MIAVTTTALSLVMVTSAAETRPKQGSAEKKLEAELKSIRVNRLCQTALTKLEYAMPYANKHGISQADAVTNIQSIASDSNKPVVRHMAIATYYGLEGSSKPDVLNYCVKQLLKRTADEIADNYDLLDGGDALTLFVTYQC